MRTFSHKGFNYLVPVLALAIMAVPMLVQSQDVASGSAIATILPALTVTATAALDFGNVYQGVSKTIAPNNADAGIFTLGGSASAGVSVYMQLPDYLQDAVSNDRMVIAFSATDAVFDPSASADPTTPGLGHTDENPHAFSGALTLGAGGAATIFLGGKVDPSVNQTAGSYTGDIVLTVAYTGA
ncbi:hypothetical protein C3F09_01120 [candidate division GN15 bacterium]|uniref:DUF4402 domain-containing protein n=1 Tax=candidate division GN15 bacterium TaxID=2072418 RepID=A0A855X580_9BACT|nr:MAG: hypothetical protein C3F09_01120 [candidate division GN15 bacterium]